MIALEYHDDSCSLADPLTPLAAAVLPDDVPTSSAADVTGCRDDDGAEGHTVFDGHCPDFWTIGRPGLRDIEGVHREHPRGWRDQSGPGGQRPGLQWCSD